MKNTFKISIVFCLSLVILFGNCSSIFAEKNKQTNTATHYIAHTISEGLHIVAAGSISLVGTVAGIAMISAAGMDRYNPDRLLAAAGLTTLLSSWAASSYMVYKAPQWTDKYWLGYTTERTTKQNVICLISKLLTHVFVVPVGICAGEFISHLDGFVPEAEQTDNK